MNVDTGAFTKLTAEVERMAGLVDTLSQKFEAMSTRALVSEVMYEAGRADERAALLGGLRPGRRNPSRRDGSRPGHLSLAPDGRRSS